MLEPRVQVLSEQLVRLLSGWIAALPVAGPSTREWVNELLNRPQYLGRAMGFSTAKRDVKAVVSMLESEAPTFEGWRSSLNQRLQIYLGGAEGLAAAPDAPTLLHGHRGKLRELREMLSHQSRSWPRHRRTLFTVEKAVKSGSLGIFWTSEADSDLWVVLKTLQENFDSAQEEALGRLVDWVTVNVTLDLTGGGNHILDRRHAWWAVRTLYQASARALYSDDPSLLKNYLDFLLQERPAQSNSVAKSSSLVPDFHNQLLLGWELVNVSELLRGDWNAAVDIVSLRALQEREESLMNDLLSEPPPVDMRVATVHARATLTYLANECPSLWGKDV